MHTEVPVCADTIFRALHTQPSIIDFFKHLFIASVQTFTSHSLCVEVRGHLAKVNSPFLPCGCWGSTQVTGLCLLSHLDGLQLPFEVGGCYLFI